MHSGWNDCCIVPFLETNDYDVWTLKALVYFGILNKITSFGLEASIIPLLKLLYNYGLLFWKNDLIVPLNAI